MNPNDLIAQQQAIFNQAMQTTHQLLWVYWMLAILAVVIHFTILYLFYARLRDIADELRAFRIAYEFVNERKAPRPSSESPLRSQASDLRHMQK